MKLMVLSCVALLSLLVVARADLTITQKSEGAAQAGDLVIKIKGDKTRVDMNSQLAMVIDGKTGDIATIMFDKKQVMRIPGDKARAMAEMVNQFSKSGAAKPKLVASGKKETINGYECEEYKVEGGLMPASYWLTTKYPDYAAILQQLRRTKPSAWDPSKMGMPGYDDLPGLPMRVIMQMPNQTTITTTITSIKNDPLADDQFVVPKDFAEMQMPDMSKMPGGRPVGEKP